MEGDAQATEATLRPQHLIVSIFGRYGRANGGSVPIASLIELMAALDVDAGVVRSSVSRLKQRGVLVSEPAGRAAYRLSESLEEVFAAGDRRIFQARRATPEDPWLLVSFSVPERERPVRHRLRQVLRRLGFGQISGGLWVAPGLIADETRAALRHAGVEGYVELFLGSRLSAEPLADAVQRWWELSDLAPLYRLFIDAYAPMRRGAADDREAFRVYIAAMTQWRRLAYLDPGIPFALLPDEWVGVAAEQLFRELHDVMDGPAERFVKTVMR